MSHTTPEVDILKYLLEASLADSPAEARARTYALDRVGLIKATVPPGRPLMTLDAIPLEVTVANVYSDELREFLGRTLLRYPNAASVQQQPTLV